MHRCNHPTGLVPANFENLGTECIWSPPTFASSCHFYWALWDIIYQSTGLYGRVKGRSENERNRGEAITEDKRERIEKEKGVGTAPT